MKYLILTIVLASHIFAQWEWVNPKYPHRDFFDIVALNESTFVACGENGIILRSSDYGETIDVTEGVANFHEVLRSIYFINEEIGWIAGDVSAEGQFFSPIILKTIDGGKTWTRQYLSDRSLANFHLESIGFADEQNGWVGGQHILAHTTDGGDSWDINIGTNNNFHFIEFPDSLHGVISSDYGLLFTSDGGNNWDTTHITGDTPDLGCFINNDIGYLGSWSKIYYVSNWGNNFITLLNNNYEGRFRALDMLDNQTGIIAYNVFDWNNWQNKKESKTILYSNTKSGGWDINDLGIRAHTNSIDLVTSNLGYAVGTAGLIYRIHPDSISAWDNINEVLLENLITFSKQNDDIWCLTQERKIYKYNLNSQLWSQISITPNVNIYDILALEDLVLAASSSGLIKIYDSGFLGFDPSIKKNLSSIQSVNNTVWISALDGTIFKSHKNYTTWEKFKIPNFTKEDSLMKLQIVNDTLLYALGKNNKVYKTANSSKTWEKIESAFFRYGNISALYFIDELNGFAVNENGLLIHTTDGGSVWRQKAVINPPSFNDIIFYNNLGWACGSGTEFNLYFTTDGGQTWLADSLSKKINLTNLQIYNDELWLSSARGALIKININNSIPGNRNKFSSSENLKINFINTQNYPNPFNPTTRIKYQVASIEIVSLKVYDILGREIVTLIDNKPMQPGEYEVEFDGSNLPSGVYLYRITSGDFVQSRKMVLIK